MKKRIFIAFTALIVFGLVAVAYAYNRTNTTDLRAANSCCQMANCCADGKCKMNGACCAKQEKSETASVDEKHSCSMADCCKDGKCSMGGACCKAKDSCPMKAKETAQTTGVDMTNVVVVAGDEQKSCCATGSACCNGGACCKKENNDG